MWKPHVFSKLATNPIDGDVDEFHVLTEHGPTDYQSSEKISRRPGLTEERSVAFIQDCGDRFYIGVDGRVPDILGQDHPYAYEIRQSRQGPVKGRPITFVHGYFAPKDATIPSIEHLVAEQPKHLEEILRRANLEGAVQGKPIKVAPVTFPGAPSATTTKWDEVAREFEAGKHAGGTATFTKDGKLFRWLEPEAGRFAGQVLDSAQKKTTAFEVPAKMAFLPLAAIGLGVLATGWLIREILRALSNEGHSHQKNR